MKRKTKVIYQNQGSLLEGNVWHIWKDSKFLPGSVLLNLLHTGDEKDGYEAPPPSLMFDRAQTDES